MTYAEELLQQGRQEGVQLGEKKGERLGIEKGISFAKSEMAKEMLKAGAELSFIQKFSHFSKKEIKQIKKRYINYLSY